MAPPAARTIVRVDLDAYLSRLGMTPPLAADAGTLCRVQVAHLAAFPFHNLTIQRGQPVTTDTGEILARFLADGGGGYCFEQNTLLAAALRALGFDVTPLLGRVGPPERRALNHLLLRVDLGGRPWLADAGFGGEGPLEPIPLESGARVLQNGIEYALRRDAHHWTLSMRWRDGGEDLYEFSGAPHTAGDVEMANYYTSTHPESIFRKTLTIQRVTAQERVILRPKVVTRYRDGVRTDRPIEPHELRRYARELFGLEVGDEPLLFERSGQ